MRCEAMTDPDDFALLDAWAAGDTAAAKTLLGRHVGALFRFFDRKIDGAADDLVQETMLGCLRGRALFRGETPFRGYLFGIARNVLFDHLRARHRAATPLDLESSCLADLSPSPSQHVAAKREQRILLDALRRLPLQTQVLLELYHFQGCTGPELASIYGVGEKALRSRLHRGKEMLQAAMAELAETPELLASSVADFESWARGLPDPGDDATS